MAQKFIRINSHTTENRHEMINKVKDALSHSRAIIINFKMFSNRSICFFIEISNRDIHQLYINIQQTGLVIDQESHIQIKEYLDQQKPIDKEFDIFGTIEITFIHNDPDLRIEVPPFDL